MLIVIRLSRCLLSMVNWVFSLLLWCYFGDRLVSRCSWVWLLVCYFSSFVCLK